jgi:histidine triad (HIT) family protein
MPGCEFCRIVAGLIPAEVVYETDATLAFFPFEPATKGHTLVIPKRHVDNFLNLESRDIPNLGAVVVRVGRALQSVLRPEGMNLISSAGEAASQSVMHVHVHLVPRWQDDAVGEIWPPKRPTSERVLEDTADAIREFCATEHLEQRNPE